MKSKNYKKLAVAAALCLIASGGIAYGAGKITILRSSIDPGSYKEYDSYGDLEKAEMKAGFDAAPIECFSNGFSFSKMDVSETEGVDDTGNVMEKWRTISIDYKNTDGRAALLTMQPAKHVFSSDGPTAAETRTILDIPVSYYCYETLFVPEGYDISEEDMKRQETDPNFFISYGTRSVETQISHDVSFDKDDIHYQLSGSNELRNTELYDMAAELIEQAK